MTKYCSVCLSVLFIIALIAPLLCREGKQAIKNKTDWQTEHYVKGGSKICCKGTSSPTLNNAWGNIPF